MTERSWLAPIHLLATVGTKVVVFNHLTGQARAIDDRLYARLYSPTGDAVHGTTADDLSPADLRKAEEAQLIVRERRILERLKGGDDRPPCRIGAVAIVTKNRPATLVRLLDALLLARQQNGRAYRVIVVDDSIGHHRDRVRRAVAAAGKRHGAAVEYVGQTERRRLIGAMSGSGSLTQRILSFTMQGAGYAGPTFGAALNTALLSTAGTPVALFDDDIVPQVGVPDYADPTQMRLASDYDPTTLRIHSSLAAAAKTISWSDADPVACHEEVLGASLGHVARRLPSHLQPDSPPAAFKLLRGPAANGRIGVTAFGIVGDCGMGSLHNYIGIRDDDLVRLIAAGASYRKLIRSRWVTRAAPCLVINGGGFLMGAAIGVDNTSVVPPFVPLWRNSDGLFAQCLLACADDVYLGFLPKVVQHLPPSRRAGRTGSAQHAASIGVSHVLSYLTRAYPGRHAHASTVDKLKGLGDYLQSIGSQSPPVFMSMLRRTRDEILSGHLVFLQRRSREVRPDGGGYRSWLADVDAQKAALAKKLTAGSVPVVSEISVENLRTLICDVGAMFAGWPDLWAALRDRAESRPPQA